MSRDFRLPGRHSNTNTRQYNYSTVQYSNKEHGMSLDKKLIAYVNILHTKHIQVHILDKILGMTIETALL